jgi:hypothetical protein
MVCRAVTSDEELQWSPEEFMALLDISVGGLPPVQERLEAGAVATTSSFAGDPDGGEGAANVDLPPVDQAGAATIRVRVPVR